MYINALHASHPAFFFRTAAACLPSIDLHHAPECMSSRYTHVYTRQVHARNAAKTAQSSNSPLRMLRPSRLHFARRATAILREQGLAGALCIFVAEQRVVLHPVRADGDDEGPGAPQHPGAHLLCSRACRDEAYAWLPACSAGQNAWPSDWRVTNNLLLSEGT